MFLDALNCIQTIIQHVKFAPCLVTVAHRNECALPASQRGLAHWASSAMRFALAEYTHKLPLSLVQVVHEMCLVKAGPFPSTFLCEKRLAII